MHKLADAVFMLIFIGIVFFILDSRAGYLKKLNETLKQGSNGRWWDRFIKTARLISGLFAAGLFLVVSAVNICTWISSSIAHHAGSLMWLHFLVLITFFIGIGFAQQMRRPEDRSIPMRGMPRWTKAVSTAIGIYALSLLAFHAIRSHGGYSINDRDGKHYIKSDGQAEREMSTDEYLQHELQDLREFSSFWMGFAFCSAAYLLLAKDETAQTSLPAP